MIDVKKIEQFVGERLAGGDMFLVEINASQANEIEILVDSDGSVGIEACVELSRAIEELFDREAEDFELTVSSAGIGRPLKLHRQYLKLVGKSVELVLRDGGKVIGKLVEATPDAITVSYPERIAVEGSKKKQTVETTRTFQLADVKSTSEYLDFK